MTSYYCLCYKNILYSLSSIVFIMHTKNDINSMSFNITMTTFPFWQATCEFSLKRDVCLSGLSTEALANASGGFLRCGVAYLRLHQFAQPPSVDSFDTTGLVSRAFRAAICRYLQYYVGCVLSVAGDSLLLQLHERLGTLQAQMRWATPVSVKPGTAQMS